MNPIMRVRYARNRILDCSLYLSYCSWSPLAKSFNYKSNRTGYTQHESTIFPGRDGTNADRAISNGIFGYKQLINNVGLLGMKNRALYEKDILLFECLDPNRERKLVTVMDDLSDTLCRIADLCEFLRIMHKSVDIAIAAEEICVEIGRVIEELNTNKSLYDTVKQVAVHDDKFPMTDIEKRVIELFAFDFEMCGIHLPDEARQKVVKYTDIILQCSHSFKQNAENYRLLHKDSVTPLLKQYFQLTNDDNLIVTGYANIKDEIARELAYKVTLAGNETQEKLFDQILTGRQKLAEICGFPTYAHRALKGCIAQEPEFVISFLDELNINLRDYVKSDVELMSSVKATESSRPLAMWDVAYLTSKIKRDSLSFELKEFFPYFSIGACMEGLNLITENLFGIQFISEKLPLSEEWAPDVFKLSVFHKEEGYLGDIYCDFFERQDKPQQDCHFTLKGGRRTKNGMYQNPIVVVVLSLPRPTSELPSLLSPDMAENLFHEMGHAMHSMLGRSEFQHVTGTRCATDFAEVPSILMEYFFSDKRVLKSFARHYKTGERIPDELIDRLINSRKICAASDLQAQIFYSALDYIYHTDKTAPGRTTDVLRESQEKYYMLPYVEPTAWQLRFSHLVGYGAKYYSYLMSRSIASIIWHKYFLLDPFSRKEGKRYRQECLSHGGTKPPRLLIKDYLGTDITPASITNYIFDEIKFDYEKIL